jgi:hypothetical protein
VVVDGALSVDDLEKKIFEHIRPYLLTAGS